MIDTARLTLRRPDPSDWESFLAYRRSARSTLGREAPTGEAWSMFAALFGHWQLRGFGRFIAVRRDTGRPIGHFGPFFPEGHPEPELTWTIWDAADEGRGYAHEAAMAARAHAFGPLGWTTAVSYIDRANTRSQALAARLGAVREPGAPTPWTDTAEVWRHGRGRIA